MVTSSRCQWSFLGVAAFLVAVPLLAACYQSRVNAETKKGTRFTADEKIAILEEKVFKLEAKLERTLAAPDDAVLAAIRSDVNAHEKTIEAAKTERAELVADFERVREGWTRANALAKSMLERQGDQQEKLQELRWEFADLLIAHQRNTKDAVGNEAHPENTVIVQKGYPNERIPFGVVIDDQRPAEKRLKMHYLSVDLGNGLEKRVYPEVVEWRGEPEAK